MVLVDDNELLRQGIKALVSDAGDIEVIGEARDKAQAIELVRFCRPDVILLNLELKCANSLEMVSDLLTACKTSRMAVLTNSRDPEVHRRAMSRGAIGVISNEDTPESLRSAIKQVHSGAVWLDRIIAAKVIADLASGKHRQNPDSNEKRISTLTEREHEVVRLIGEGLKNKEIARRLFISPVTVHHHLTTIYSKLDVKDRLELIVFAYKNRLAEVPR